MQVAPTLQYTCVLEALSADRLSCYADCGKTPNLGPQPMIADATNPLPRTRILAVVPLATEL